jgi:hypothetical protein
MEIKRIYTFVEETRIEGGRALDRPLIRSAAAAVIQNPLAGRFEQDLTELIDAGEQVGELLAPLAVKGLGGEAPESYGKAAIVGLAGEREHAAALLHPKLGAPLRRAVDRGAALIPSAKKLGGPGASIDVPLHYKDAMKVRSHFDGMEVRIPDAPAADEIVIVIAVTNGGRPHARVGGLELADAVGEDGIN